MEAVAKCQDIVARQQLASEPQKGTSCSSSMSVTGAGSGKASSSIHQTSKGSSNESQKTPATQVIATASEKCEKSFTATSSEVVQAQKHVTDDFFLHQSKSAIQLRRVIDFEMKRKVQANPRLIYSATPKISAQYWAIFDS